MGVTQPLSELDQMIVELVTEMIASLPRDKSYLAKQLFPKEVWETAPTHYGQRIAFLTATHRLPLRYHETTSSNSHTYWITSV
jgi:hypothetical protein